MKFQKRFRRKIYHATQKKKKVFVESAVCFLKQASTVDFWNTGQKTWVDVKGVMSGRQLGTALPGFRS